MSSKKSGYSLYKDKKLMDYGCWEITYEQEKDWRERIKIMFTKLCQYCETHKIDYIYCEDVPPVIENSQTVKVLSALQGCVIALCLTKNIELTFVPVAWKKTMGIDLTHSKEYKGFVKTHKIENMTKFKEYVKAYEKKMSIENVNNFYDLSLVWKSPSSKFNQDDIADSMNLVLSRISPETSRYKLKTFDEILDEIYKITNTKRLI